MDQLGNNKEAKRYLQCLNEGIEAYVKETLDYKKENIREWDQSLLPSYDRKKKRVLRCWEAKQCHHGDCPAFNNEDYRCWLIAGTMCGGIPQGAFAHKYSSCYQCEVFKEFSYTELHRLHENISILIKHLQDKIESLKEFAIKDSLTGLYNRHYLGLVREREVERARRNNQPITVIVFDLNKFKEVNDTWGHHTGDAALKEFSAFLREHARTEDLLFRLGGDEFMLLMLGTTVKQRENVEMRLFEGIRAWNKSSNKLPVQLSFSLGGATGIEPVNFDSLMAEADKVLYQCKQSKDPGS